MKLGIAKLKILILDDSLEDALLVLATLQQSGLEFKHEHVFDQFEYLDSLEKGAPDIILSDYGLKGYNGLAALRDKKELGINCPFIMVTGSLPDEIAVECLRAGVDDYILKDRLSRLPDAVKGVMERQKADQERRLAFSELIKSQKRLEAAEKMAQMGNWEWEPPSNTTNWSDEMYNILEVNKQEYSPTIQSFLEFIAPQERPSFKKILKEITSGRQTSGEGRFEIKTFGGKTKIIRSIYKSNGGSILDKGFRVFGTIQDVTLLHKTEKRLLLLTEELEQRVEQRTQELLQTNKLLKHKNEEMTDSINYAKLIQEALLAKLDECTRIFPKSFILWKPRDIVSGDFYWQHQNGLHDYIAVVDCTGHGVPGAMMSMIGHQLLNQVVIIKGVSEPAEILEELDNSVDEALLAHTEAGVRDGMDIILCRIDRAKKQISFSGAYRPLFHVSSSGLVEHQGNRSPIGNFTIENPNQLFEQHTIDYQKGDTIYLTSDGYYSQFGGPAGKKMMKTRFKALLEDVGQLPMNKQYDRLHSFLEEWQGNEAQVDDILIVGIQF